jgi:soluble lytic murein transglycosylase-like protein
MRHTRNTSYVHMGDRVRRRRRAQRALVAVGLCVASATAWASRSPTEAHAETSTTRHDDITRLRTELDATRGELELAQAQLDRWSEIFTYSSRYNIGADLATSVYDVALAEGIEPDLGFRLVRAESEFNPRATSPVGAVGLTQVMPATARYFEKGITRERLYDRHTNLRIGFRYLRTLVREQKGNVRLALLVYNRGPVAVEASRRRGVDPSNGYDRNIMKGYTGRGVTD